MSGRRSGQRSPGRVGRGGETPTLAFCPEGHRVWCMAKGSRQIPRSEWRQYFDDFSRNLPALAASIEVDGPETGAQIEAERGLLTGISYDDRDDIVVIV